MINKTKNLGSKFQQDNKTFQQNRLNRQFTKVKENIQFY